MNIIECVKDILNNCSIVQDFFQGDVTFDFVADSNGENGGLISVGDSLLKEDIIGSQRIRHGFVLYARCQNITEYEAKANSNFLLDLGFYLRNLDLNDMEVSAGEKTGCLVKLEAANGMNVSLLTGSVAGPCEYQLQINAEYIVNP